MSHPPLHQFLGFMLGSVHRRISNQFARALKPFDITPEQWSVLYMIAGREGINQKDVAAATSKDQPTTARIIDLLLKKGYVTKQMSPVDRRAFLLYATEQGRTLIETTFQFELESTRTAVAGLSPEQLEQLHQMLNHIYNNTAHQPQE
jgi:MarR family transcriptional regulator, transcriptional regulator for hemolysin